MPARKKTSNVKACLQEAKYHAEDRPKRVEYSHLLRDVKSPKAGRKAKALLNQKDKERRRAGTKS